MNGLHQLIRLFANRPFSVHHHVKLKATTCTGYIPHSALSCHHMCLSGERVLTACTRQSGMSFPQLVTACPNGDSNAAGPAHAARRKRVRFTEPPRDDASAQNTSKGTSEHHEQALPTRHRQDTNSATTRSTSHMKEAVTNPPVTAEQCTGQPKQDTSRRLLTADKQSTAATAAAGNNISSTQHRKKPTAERLQTFRGTVQCCMYQKHHHRP